MNIQIDILFILVIHYNNTYNIKLKTLYTININIKSQKNILKSTFENSFVSKRQKIYFDIVYG